MFRWCSRQATAITFETTVDVRQSKHDRPKNIFSPQQSLCWLAAVAARNCFEDEEERGGEIPWPQNPNESCHGHREHNVNRAWTEWICTDLRQDWQKFKRPLLVHFWFVLIHVGLYHIWFDKRKNHDTARRGKYISLSPSWFGLPTKKYEGLLGPHVKEK